MATDYKTKYLTSVNLFYQLHSVLSGLTIELTGKVHGMRIPSYYKSQATGIIEESADKIKEIDNKFKDLVRINLPVEKR